MAGKRNPIKQIMSDVHKDSRAGKIDLKNHGGFIAEVKRRVRGAGLADDEVDELVSQKEHGKASEQVKPGPRAPRA
jgi:hypothetical protein